MLAIKSAEFLLSWNILFPSTAKGSFYEKHIESAYGHKDKNLGAVQYHVYLPSTRISLTG